MKPVMMVTQVGPIIFIVGLLSTDSVAVIPLGFTKLRRVGNRRLY